MGQKRAESEQAGGRKWIFDVWSRPFPGNGRECWNRLLAQCLALLFINLSVWILAAMTFKIVEGGIESSYKCGELLISNFPPIFKTSPGLVLGLRPVLNPEVHPRSVPPKVFPEVN